MRRRHIILAGDLSGWPFGTTPSPADLQRLDQYSSELVNGEEGGTWSPENPIVVGPYRDPSGASTETIDLSAAGSSLTGDIITVKGNSKAGTSMGLTGLVLTGGAVPEFQTARTRNVIVPFIGFIESTNAARGFREHFEIDPTVMGCRGIYKKVSDDLTFSISQVEPATTQIVTVPFPIRAQHRDATIDEIVFRVLIVGQYNAVPATPMKFRVLRYSGTTHEVLHSNGGGYDANGWLADTAVTAADYMNGGQVREFSYVPDQNNVVSDTATQYFLLQATASSDFRNSVFLSARVSLSGLANMQQE